MYQSPVVLTGCDQEPIHLSGAIQPHGYLLGVERTRNTVEYASENVSKLIDLEIEKILGAQGEGVKAKVLARAALVHQFQSGNFDVFEFEALHSGSVSDHADRLLKEIQTITAVADSIDELNQTASDCVQRLTGFARIMIYKFAEDWTGTVVAETIEANKMPSFFDLRFPSSDIPVQARRLYSEKLLRYIPDVNSQAVAIRPSGMSLSLDLSASDLRSVSPIHIEYLKNMEVGASMSLSIMVDGRLWGLIACHDPQKQNLSNELRDHCKILAGLYARLLATQEQATKERARAESKATQVALLDRLSTYEDFADGLSENDGLLLQLVHAPGALLQVEDRCIALGDAPADEQARKLLATISAKVNVADEPLFSTDNFDGNGNGSGVSGLLSINLSDVSDIFLTWLRPEVISEVNWAGEPTKLESSDERLHPRRSFALWKETVSGHSQPWTEEELAAAAALRQYLKLKIERDHAENERGRLNLALKDSNQKLVQFVDTISHDLRSPLISISNLADWIKKDMGENQPDEVKDNIHLLQKRAGKMKSQLNELLNYSKAGNYRAEPELVDVNLMVGSIIEMLGNSDKVRFAVYELPCFETLKAPLEHVFHNLIENAIKYTERPNGKIEIGYSEQGRFYEFFVKDEGKGIPEEFQSEIFMPLRTLSGADSESHGMGLAFVKRLVEQAGGEVQVQSAPNMGSTFKFTWKKVWDVNNAATP